jgi:hypothetical protein
MTYSDSSAVRPDCPRLQGPRAMPTSGAGVPIGPRAGHHGVDAETPSGVPSTVGLPEGNGTPRGNGRKLDKLLRASPIRSVLTASLRQDLDQVDFGRRRFRLRPGASRHALQSAGQSFLEGFNAFVAVSGDNGWVDGLDAMDPELRGFAYEGAGMACAMLDVLTLSRGRRMDELISGAAQTYPHMVYVGAGWAYARLRLRPWWGIRSRDPLLRWLAWDGFGFHQGFFHANRVVGAQCVERGLAPDQRAIRDQGLGRLLWFHECADPDGIALRVGEFSTVRHADLWSGIGLAATYAGAAEPDELDRLVVLAGDHRADLAQGCAFACKARRVSAVVPAHTEKAAIVLAGVNAAEAAVWTDQAQIGLGPGPLTARHYQQWRAEIRRLWSERQGHA